MRILQVAHQLPPRFTAGTEVYTLRLAKALTQLGHDVHLVSGDDSGLTRPGTLRDGSIEGLPHTFVGVDRVAATAEETLFPPATRGVLAPLVATFRPDVIHVQHLRHLGFHVFDGAPRVRLVMTLHDHWLACARDGQLLDARGRPCPGATPERCRACLDGFRFGLGRGEAAVARTMSRFGIRSGSFPARWLRSGALALRRLRSPSTSASYDLEARRAAVGALAASTDRFIAPSRHVADALTAFGLPAEKMVVIPHGVDADPGFRAVPAAAGAPLRIGYMGTVAPPKGLHVLVAAFSRLGPGEATLRVHGRTDLRPEYVSSVVGGGLPPGVTIEGAFRPDEAPRRLAEIDVLVVPSIWPDNHPLTITEALAHRVPVVASALGGIPEIVKDGVNGRLVPPGDPGALAEVLAGLARDRVELARLRAGITPPESFLSHAASVVVAYDTREVS